MQNLLNFLYRFRTFGLFLILEGLCAWLIIVYNHRYNVAFLNSSNTLVASINRATNNTSDYFKLRQINEQLVRENLVLRRHVVNMTSSHFASDTAQRTYDLRMAKVINNTFRRSLNFLTLNSGHEQGIRPGMGVVSDGGVVGQVKSVSENFATVISLLHRNLLVSGSVKRTKTLCTVQWDGQSHREAELRYIPRHIILAVGDTVVTSGYNAVFPEGIMVGRVSEFKLDPDDVFYDARIELSVDFSSLDYVYVISHRLKAEKDSLEREILLMQ